MKKTKRLLSLFLAIVMMMNLVPISGIMSSASSNEPGEPKAVINYGPTKTLAKTGEPKAILAMPPEVTFTVPETLWLGQDTTGASPSVPAAQTKILAYSNITNTVGTQATGELSFNAEGATNLSITAKQADASVISFGEIANLSGANFSHTLANGAELPIAVGANATALIEWTAEYELPAVAPGETFTSRAYSIAYAPNSEVTGAFQGIQHTGQGGGEKYIMIWESGAAFFMSGLQNVSLDSLPTNNAAEHNPGSPWLYAPTKDLSDYVLGAEAEDTYKTMEETIFGENIHWRNNVSKLFYTNGGIGEDYREEGGRPSGAVTDVNSANKIVYRTLRNNVQVAGTQDQAMLEEIQKTGRFVEHWVRHKVGSMELDISRFSNLGQVPGMHFASFYPDYIGDVNDGPKHFRIRIQESFGDYIKLGTNVGGSQATGYQIDGYTKTFDSAPLKGQNFSSDGRQVSITSGEGTQNIVAEALYTAYYDFFVVEKAGCNDYDISGKCGNRAIAGFNFDINKTDKSSLRSAALQNIYPDEFYEDAYALNIRKADITTKLGNPLSNSKEIPADNNILDIGADKYWRIGYELTVINGSADSNVATEGQELSIIADAAPQNYIFVGWTSTDGGTFADATSASTTFIMPGNATTIQANYELGQAQKYTVNLSNGSIAGSETEFAAGDIVTITADSPQENMQFKEWLSEDVSFANAADATTTFIMPAKNVNIIASYEAIPKYTLTLNGGTANIQGEHYAGTVITITANDAPAGKVFDSWTGDVSALEDANSETTTLTMPSANVSVTATYKDMERFAVSVTNGIADIEEAYEGQLVSITANEAPANHKFVGWSSNNDIVFANALSASTTFIMTAENVSLTANYEELPKYTVDITNGTISGGQNKFYAGETVNIIADEAPANHKFVGWSSNNDIVFANALSASATFIMTAENVSLTANYEELPKYTVNITNGTISGGQNKFYAGETVNIIADEAEGSDYFTAWSVISGGISFADANSNTTSFVMPDNDVEIIANYASIPTYTLTIEGGTTAGGSYIEGTAITIRAAEPQEGMRFKEWISDDVDFADASSKTTTIIMPAANAKVTATYEAIPKYTLTLNGGTANIQGEHYADTVIIITADEAPAGKVFDSWTGDVSALEDANSKITNLTMPNANVTLTATYKDMPRFAISINNGSSDISEAYEGQVVTITANDAPANHIFIGWSSTSGITFADESSQSTTFIMTAEDVVISANYQELPKFSLTINGGTANIQGEHYAGTIITITADEAPAGKVFDSWTGDVSALEDANSKTTNLTMPSANVTLTASYKDMPRFAISINNGSSDIAEAYEGQVVTITANDAPANHIFIGWSSTSGITFADESSQSTTFIMTAEDVVISANYQELPKFSLTINGGTANIQGEHYAGTLITITADEAPAGKVFDSWTGDVSALEDANSKTTNLTMPNANVSVTATYKDMERFAIIVNNGIANMTEAYQGQLVTITANDEPEGQRFVSWFSDTLTLEDASAKETTFIMPNAEVEITAIYVDLADTELLELRISEFLAVEKANYTDATWAAFQAALADAEDIAANPNATQEEVDDALAALNNAYEALEEISENDNCGCCDEHNHDLSTIWGRIACWFCKLVQYLKKLFGI